MSDYEATITNWFRRELGGSLILPDGWFGRPYDNQLMLTKLTRESNVVEVVLDDHLSLKLFDLRSVQDDGTSLIFSEFAKLIFDWMEFGNESQTHQRVFESGVVKIVGAPPALAHN